MTVNSGQTINPLVSVIIPAYNRSLFLKRAVRSVLGQTYPHLEAIVIDDGSTDETAKIIAALCEDDTRLCFIRHAVNKGAQAARNTGIKAAKGSYIAFLDSDDEWLPDKLEKQMGLFAHGNENLGVVYAGYREISFDGQQCDHLPHLRGDIYTDALRQWVCDMNTLVVKKPVFDKSGFLNENIRAYQEWDLCIHLARHGTFDYISEPLAIYHHHCQPTISKDRLSNALGYLDVVEAHHDDILKYCGYYVLSNHFLSIGHHFMLADDTIKAKEYFIKAFRLAPYDILSFFFLFASSLGFRNYRLIQQMKKMLTDYFKS